MITNPASEIDRCIKRSIQKYKAWAAGDDPRKAAYGKTAADVLDHLVGDLQDLQLQREGAYDFGRLERECVG